jgi:hypothetical protein
MKFRSLNWAAWAGFLLSLFVLVSYPFIFARWPITRDVPWASLLLFASAVVLIFLGIRGAFRAGRSKRTKISATVLSVISVGALGLFVFTTFVMPRWLPESKGAPQVGQKAPEFSLADTTGKQLSLSGLLTTPINGRAPKGVLLIFYRGSW